MKIILPASTGRGLAFFAVLVVALGDAAAEVSTKAPAPYEREIAGWFTPLASVLAEKDPHRGKDEPGTIRLLETITRVEEDGTYLRALRYIYQPYTAKGAEALATDRFGFQSRMEKVHLVRARTILPDGTEKTPGPNAVFTQKGSQASGSIYDDAEELVIVFPDVKPGVTCEAVVVYERTTPSVAGGHGEIFHWTAGWPIGAKRHIVDLPASWENKLKVHAIGSVPNMISLPAPDGRIRREWRHGPIDATVSEPNMAPASQIGPVTWLTTFADWNEMAAWYQTLLDGRNELGDELKQSVDEWTAGATTPRDILDILYDKVANDVRYEGLEFGISGLQPYACGTVWENQYGDCKDKSNLLAAMLRHKGIEARLALVNTRHAGLVRRDIPDFRHFDHAILVAELAREDGGSETVFCDPTIRHGHPGMLTPGSADRDVLVIHDGKAQWLRSPATDAGTDRYLFDLELDESGRLSGWLTMRSTGYYAIGLARSLAGVDRDTARIRLGERVSGFIAGAEVVDFVLPEIERKIEQTEVKIYFTSPPRPRDGDARLSLPMPSTAGMYNRFGDGKDRRTSYHMWPDRISVEAKVRLPQGWAADALPSPLHLETPHYEVSAKWEQDDTSCTGHLDIKCLQALIPADQVAAAARVNRTLFSWLEVPLLLKRGARPAVANHKRAIRMPVMPTGEGQMELVNRLFPRDGDAEPRRAALRQVMRDFADEPATHFDARVELAYLAYAAGDHAAAERDFARMVASAGDGVWPESIAYARYLRALALEKMQRTDEAVAIMRDLAADASLTDFRRSWAAMMAGQWLLRDADAPPAEALDLLEQAIAMKENAGDTALDLLIPALAKAGESKRLIELLANAGAFELSSDNGELAIQSLAGIDAEQSLAWLAEAARRTTEPAHKELLGNAGSKLATERDSKKINETLRAELVELIRLERPDEIRTETIPADANVEEIEKQLNDLAAKDRTKWRAMIAVYFARFANAPDFSHQLWQYISHISSQTDTHNGGTQRYFEALMKIAERMPASDPNFWEIQFVKASWLTGHGRLDDAEALYRSMSEHPDFDKDFDHAAHHRLGTVLERQGKWDEAIACYIKFSDARRDSDSVAEHLLRAGVLMALSDREEEALETWKLLADVPRGRYAESGYHDEITEAIEMAEQPEDTLAQWQRTRKWWEMTCLPLLDSLGAGKRAGYHPYYSAEADELNAACIPAKEKKDLATISRETLRVAATARVLPEYVQYYQQMHSLFVLPVKPSATKATRAALAELCAAIRTGRKTSVEICQRLAAATRLELGDPSLSIELLAGVWRPGGEGSAEHKERSGYIFCLAAASAKRQLEEAIACCSQILDQGPAFFPRSQWLALHADLLVAADRHSDALALLETAATSEAIANDKGELAEVNRKIQELKTTPPGTEDIGKAATAFLERVRPAWYEHVGPEDLADPRLDKPEDLLEEEPAGFHATELFRSRMLLAMSGKTSDSIRNSAFILAAIQAGTWQKDSAGASELWKSLLDDPSLPVETRLQLLWRAALELGKNGFADELAGLKSCEVFGNFKETYRNVYFPFIECQAAIMAGDRKTADDFIKRITGMQLDAIALDLASRVHASLLTKGEVQMAKDMRDALKKWNFATETISKRIATRLDWSRLAKRADEGIKLHRTLLDVSEETLRAKLPHAPESWQSRMEVAKMHDLSRSARHAVHARQLLTGERHDQTGFFLWFTESDVWLANDDDEVCRRTLFKALDALRETRDDMTLCLLMVALLEAADQLDDWREVDERLMYYRDASKFPATHGMICLWQLLRDFKPADELDAGNCLDWISKLPYKPPFHASLLHALILKGDKAGIERVLDTVPADELTQIPALAAHHDALAFLERDEEIELLNDVIDTSIGDLMRDAWLAGTPYDFHLACCLALRHGREELLPAEFLEEVPKMMGDPDDRKFAQAHAHAMAGKWNETITTLEKINDKNIRDDAEWNHLIATALIKTGQTGQAAGHLQSACKHSFPGEIWYLAARELLNQVSKTE